jgi:hypothetical protein
MPPETCLDAQSQALALESAHANEIHDSTPTQPSLSSICHLLSILNMDMWRLVVLIAVEEEPVRPDPQNCRHGYSLRCQLCTAAKNRTKSTGIQPAPTRRSTLPPPRPPNRPCRYPPRPRCSPPQERIHWRRGYLRDNRSGPHPRRSPS